MLRMYLLQIWFNLSDPATEDAIYDSYAMRKFTGIDFMTEAVPDETTLCKIRHLLEANGLNKLYFGKRLPSIKTILTKNPKPLAWSFHGSPCWTRTNDLRINSPSLYRLS